MHVEVGEEEIKTGGRGGRGPVGACRPEREDVLLQCWRAPLQQ